MARIFCWTTFMLKNQKNVNKNKYDVVKLNKLARYYDV